MAGKSRPCIYKYSCGYDFCLKEECPEYIAKTKDNEYYGLEEMKKKGFVIEKRKNRRADDV